MKHSLVAIDGPVSSGKTTVGRQLALELGYLFIDTGLMYRAVALKVQQTLASKSEWGKAAEESRFEWKGNPASPELFLDASNVTQRLFYPEVSLLSSRISADSKVRKALVAAQKEMAKSGGVVMVGRDIGTVVLPHANLKIFLTASVDSRAQRRYEELKSKGISISLEQVKNELIQRDQLDSSRKDSPLVPANDAIMIDSTGLSPVEVARKILGYLKSRKE